MKAEHGEYLEVEFEEKSELPQGYSREDYESKDFLVRHEGLSHSRTCGLFQASALQEAP